MKLQVTRRKLDDLLKGLVRPLGFDRFESLRYARGKGEAAGHLSFPCRANGRGGLAFSCLVGVRFDAVSQWIDDGGYEPNIGPTFVAPLHLLRPSDKQFAEWTVTTPDEWAGLSGAILRELTQLAMPFIERYSSLDALLAAAGAPTPLPPDGILMDAERRVLVRAAVHLVRNDNRGAVRILDDALHERRDAPRKHTFDIDWLRKRIA
jgi:hypothetical protein